MANEYAKYPDELRKVFETAQARIVAKLDLATISEASARQKTAILKQIHEELRKLGVSAEDIIKKAGPAAYTEGTAVAASFAKFGTAITAAQFTQLDTAAVDYGVKAILGDVKFALASVDRTVTSLLDSKYLTAMRNKSINRLVVQAEASGATVGELAKDLTNLIDPRWFDDFQKMQGGQLITINGRKYRLDDYAYLSAHTRLAEVSNKGSMNWSLKNGFRFTQMSRHNGACKVCQKYQGGVYHLGPGSARDHTGTMRQSVTELPRHGAPIHPYCRHRMMPWGKIDLDTALEYGTSATYVQAKRHGREAGAIQEGNKIAARGTMKKIVLTVCAALAAFVAAENLNPPAIPCNYWISTNATWCAAKTSRVNQLAGEAFVAPVSNNVTFTWSANNAGVIVFTNSTASFTNAVAYSTPIPQSGWNIDFAGDAVAGLWLKCSSGASNLVSITWFGRP